MELLKQYQERKEKYAIEKIIALYRPWHMTLPCDVYFSGLKPKDPATRASFKLIERDKTDAKLLAELFVDDDEILECKNHAAVIELLKKRVHQESIVLGDLYFYYKRLFKF